MESEQGEVGVSTKRLLAIVERYEANPFYRSRHMLSFVGFANFLVDKHNYVAEDVNADCGSSRSSHKRSGVFSYEICTT